MLGSRSGRAGRIINGRDFELRKFLTTCFLSLLFFYGSAAASESPDAAITLYKVGQSQTIYASDIENVQVTYDGMEKIPAMVTRFSQARAEKLNQFLVAVLGEKVMAVFMGKVWLSGLTVYDAGIMRTFNTSGRTGEEYGWFVERIEAARSNESSGAQPAIELYEEIAAVPVSADELNCFEINDGVVKIRLNPVVSGKLQQAGLEGSTNGWRVSVGGHLVNDWRYKKDGEGAEFVLEGIDTALIKSLRASQL